ncbi:MULTISPECIES: TerD family protein, partial [unclassified Streptomyces]|uniref:TerD family protein n=2 Tax=Streptomyces TaxID=1883 RepID=UPI0024A7AA26
MGVSLAKGGNVSLGKEAPGLSAVLVGLGWDVRTTTGTDYGLDASALTVDEAGKVTSDQHFIFFNNLTGPDGSVEHSGDNLTGGGVPLCRSSIPRCWFRGCWSRSCGEG